MLHIKFQAAEPGEEDFKVFFTCKPWIPLDRTILNKFGKGSLDYATCQISSISAKKF